MSEREERERGGQVTGREVGTQGETEKERERERKEERVVLRESCEENQAHHSSRKWEESL